MQYKYGTYLHFKTHMHTKTKTKQKSEVKIVEEMEGGFAKVVLGLTILLGALAADVDGARTLKTFGSFGSTFPGTGSFPNTGGFGGSFPNPGSSGSSPSSGGFAFGSPSFCSFPGVRCSPVGSTTPFGSNGGGSQTP